MAQTTADTLVDILVESGVEMVFGLPGDGINGVMEALRKRRDDIRFIQVRHEEAAAFMACGYAKYTGKLGVCIATSGPGGIHLLNGLFDAKLDGAPVLAITGMQHSDLTGTHSQQDVELDKVFASVAAYNERIMQPAQIEDAAHIAIRTAVTQRTVAHLTIPIDIQIQTATDGERSQGDVPHHEGNLIATSAGLPGDEDLRRAADILNGGTRIAMLVGQGALGATDDVERVADVLGAPVVHALLGKAVLPDDSPFAVGGLGLLGTLPAQQAMEECDTFLMVGSSYPYIEFLPGQARGVQIDINPVRIGLRHPMEAGLVGDTRTALAALLPLLERHDDRGFLEKSQERTRDWWQTIEAQATRDDMPMKPQVAAWEFGKRLTDDAITSCDCGTNTTWWARFVRARRGQKHTTSGTLATMAAGLPYIIAAQLAYPDRQCAAIVGDGGFTMLMGELATAVRYQLPIKVLIIRNNSLGQIKWEQMTMLGNPEYEVELQPIDFAAVARACGASGFTIEDPADCGRIMDQAFATDGPVVIDAIVDPLEPSLPPKITFDQARHFAESLARGEPNRAKIAVTALRDTVRQLI